MTIGESPNMKTGLKERSIALLGIIVLSGILACGCAARVVREGDTVRVNYVLKLDDGTVYESNVGDEPVEFTLGQNMTITGFEEAVIGMSVGQTKKVTIPPEKAYGPVYPELIQEVSRDMMPAGFEVAAGEQLQTTLSDGMPATVVIKEFTDTTVTVDANSPLAGKTLTFDIELLAIGGSATAGLLSLKDLSIWVLAGVDALLVVGFLLFYLWVRRRFSRLAVSRR